MESIPDLTPPGKSEKVKKEPKPKKEKVAKDPNAAKRAPRVSYGYRPDAVIRMTTKDVSKLRGARKEWYDKVGAAAGKTAKEFLEANKTDEKDPPRGWLRFFAQEGFIQLEGGSDKDLTTPAS